MAGPCQPAEPLRVELAVRQAVAVRAELHRVLAERAAKPRDDGLQRVPRVVRQRVAPERLDRSVGRHTAAPVDEQERQQPQRPAGAADPVTAGERLDGTQDPELHRPP